MKTIILCVLLFVVSAMFVFARRVEATAVATLKVEEAIVDTRSTQKSEQEADLMLETGNWGVNWTMYKDGTLVFDGGIMQDVQSNGNWLVHKEIITKIVIKETIKMSPSMSGLFNHLKKLESIEGLQYIDTSNVTNMSNIFTHNNKLNAIDVSGFDTSQVQTMREMFAHNTLGEIKGLETFDTSNVTDMSGLFRGTYSLRSVKGIEEWDVSQVKSLNTTFAYTNIEKLDLSKWDVSNVTDTQFTFARNNSLKVLNMTGWTLKTTNIYETFEGYNGFVIGPLDLSGWHTVINTAMAVDTFRRAALPIIILNKQFRTATAFGKLPMGDSYTGFWQAVGAGTAEYPEGETLSHEALFQRYAVSNDDPSRTEILDETYVWQKKGIHTVRFQDEDRYEEVDVMEGNSISEPKRPVREGRLFKGWYTKSGAKWDFQSDRMPSQSLILEAHYDNIVYIVSFHDEEKITEKEVTYGTFIPEPTQPNKVDYQFIGWQTENDIFLDFSNQTMPATDVSLYAKYEKMMDLTDLHVEDSILYVGDNWLPRYNVRRILDKKGVNVSFEALTVKGFVNTEVPGVYEISYTYGHLTRTARVTVKINRKKLEVKDSTLVVGDEWHPIDNLVTALDRGGRPVSINEIYVEDTALNFNEVGMYEVYYVYDGLVQVAQITVIPKLPFNEEDETTPKETLNEEKVVSKGIPDLPSKVPPVETVPPIVQKPVPTNNNEVSKRKRDNSRLPQTSSHSSKILTILGLSLWGCIGWSVVKRRV